MNPFPQEALRKGTVARTREDFHLSPPNSSLSAMYYTKCLILSVSIACHIPSCMSSARQSHDIFRYYFSANRFESRPNSIMLAFQAGLQFPGPHPCFLNHRGLPRIYQDPHLLPSFTVQIFVEVYSLKKSLRKLFAQHEIKAEFLRLFSHKRLCDINASRDITSYRYSRQFF